MNARSRAASGGETTRDDADGELGSLADLLREVAATPEIDNALAACYARIDRLPQRLGDFELRAVIGSGGMGRVYRARDLTLDRDVAVKVLRPVGDPAAVEAALAREAVRTAALDHPAIVTVYTTGVSDGLPYLVVEFVDGEALAHVIARGRLGHAALRRLAGDVLDGLAHAHARQLVHRDIKPHNLIVARDGRTRIVDFGIARVVRGETIDPDVAFAGTPAYMAPELWRGEPATAPSDVWAAALVLLEAATTASLRRWRDAAPTPTTAHPRRRARDPRARLAELSRRQPALARALGDALVDDPTARPDAATLRARVLGALPARGHRRLLLGVAGGGALAIGLGVAALAAPPAPRMPASVDGYFTSRRADAVPVARSDAPDVTGTWRYTQAGQLPFELTIEPAGDHLALELNYLRPPERSDVRPTISGPGYLVRIGRTLLVAAELDVAPELRASQGRTAIELEIVDADHLVLTKRIGVDRPSGEILIVSSLREDVRRAR